MRSYKTLKKRVRPSKGGKKIQTSKREHIKTRKIKNVVFSFTELINGFWG